MNLRDIKKVFSNYRKTNFLNQRKYYREVYLFSDEWKEKRNLIMTYYNNTCQDCKKKATEVHHIHYKNIFKEKFEDLIPLCHLCHEKRHGKNINQNKGLDFKKLKHSTKNTDTYNCHKCGDDFESDVNWIDLHHAKCGNTWDEYGFH